MSTSHPAPHRSLRQKLAAIGLAVATLSASFPVIPQIAQAQSGSSVNAIQQVEACLAAQPLANGAVAAAGAGMQSADLSAEWTKFSVKQGMRYQVQVDSFAAFQVELFGDCNVDNEGTAVSAGGLEFTPLADQTLYLRVQSNAAQNGTPYQLKLSERQAANEKEIPLADAPAEIHRRAANFLDQMRNSPIAPPWDNSARLADKVRLLFRPDLQTAAYYEFPVEHKDATGAFVPAGFIQLANGLHDYPITHWNIEGRSPTQELDEIAPLSADTTKFYKLDTLSYAAEYEQIVPGLNATLVATDVLQLGNLPPKLEGLELLTLAEESASYTTSTKPVGTLPVDDSTVVSMTQVLTGPDEPAALSDEPWATWAELKTNFATTYDVYLDRLAADANDEWKQEQNALSYGEGLIKDDVRTIQGLSSLTLTTISVTGSGADAAYLQKEEVKNGTALVGMKLTVLTQPEGEKGLPIDVLISYTSGATETVKFVVSALPSKKVFLPLISGGSQSVMAAESAASTAVQGEWSGWSYWWAGSHADQRLYDQIPANSANNNTPCWSGCGATAWGMLFGWADHQAALNNPGWSHRKGIYRENGGYGFDVDAPLRLDAGIRNILMEIRAYIGTYCNNGSGWTTAQGMEGAWRYLNGRTGASVRTLRSTGWWIFGTTDDDVRNRAISVIQSGRPVVIGRDSHFPLAYGYAQQSRRNCFLFICNTEYNRWFYVNQGWNGNSNGWVTANAWFAGEIVAN